MPDQPTYGPAWRARDRAQHKASEGHISKKKTKKGKKGKQNEGHISALVAQKAYHRKKTEMKACRKAWVEQFGLTKPVPTAMWPLMPDGTTHRRWVPPQAWLTEEQRGQAMCAEYEAQQPTGNCEADL